MQALTGRESKFERMQSDGSAQAKAPLVEKARWVEEKLSARYGARPHRLEAYDKDLLGALIATILSQHTSDLNSGRAYLSLKAAFPGGWNDVRSASVEMVADAIRGGGLADMKAPRIKQLVQEVYERTGNVTLDCLYSFGSDGERLAFLKSFHGIGPKTAACVLCFNMGRPVIPVDTHVHRVSGRIGLIGPKTNADKAHDELLALVPGESAYSFHVHMIEHGRSICHARKPQCSVCPVAARCDYYHSITTPAQGGAPVSGLMRSGDKPGAMQDGSRPDYAAVIDAGYSN